MPPKKGKKKAQDDDWEAELGETIAPQGEAPAEPKTEDAAADEDLGGGLMAALAKRKQKKNKKNANADFVEGEDPPQADGANGNNFESKAPQEGTFDDDDDDVFAGNYGKKKGKGGAAEKQDAPEEKKADEAPRMKTKAEKEKEKKEKEKQRKKELVCSNNIFG
jgi:translation initiation factor 5B